jgi:hypothetical protein
LDAVASVLSLGNTNHSDEGVLLAPVQSELIALGLSIVVFGLNLGVDMVFVLVADLDVSEVLEDLAGRNEEDSIFLVFGKSESGLVSDRVPDRVMIVE